MRTVIGRAVLAASRSAAGQGRPGGFAGAIRGSSELLLRHGDVARRVGRQVIRGAPWNCLTRSALLLCGVMWPFGALAANANKSLNLPAPRTIASPGAAGSREPNLASLPDGRVVMSWLEPSGQAGMALRCATFDGRQWSQPATIAAGDSFFVNWADFPSIRPLGGQRLAAHWLWRNGSGTYAYDVRVSQSENGGRTWTQPITPHRDGTATEHGFASLASAGDAVLALWLDGRKTVGHDEDSSIGRDRCGLTAIASPAVDLELIP